LTQVPEVSDQPDHDGRSGRRAPPVDAATPAETPFPHESGAEIGDGTRPGMVVVGGGECGAHAAFALRHEGWDGPITVVGREVLHAYERPPLSKALLLTDECEPVHPYSREDFTAGSIALRTGTEVASVDPAGHLVALADGTVLRYERLLLATGAQPRPLPNPARAGVLTLRTHADALRLRDALSPGRRLCVVGAGLIGLELAAAGRTRGCEVTVVEAAGQALSRVVPDGVAADVVGLHERNGVRFRWGTTLRGAEQTVTGLALELSTGDPLEVDVVAVGIGAVPETALARAAGIEIGDGILVDERLETSGADVFAAGDVACLPHPTFGGHRVRVESWRNAHEQAVTAARNMLGANEPHRSIPWFWSDQYDHTLQVAGLATLATDLVRRHRDDGVRCCLGLDRARRLVFASGFGTTAGVAREVRVAERLIAAGGQLSPAALADPAVPLQSLLPSTA